jgi:protein gp37
MENSKISWTEHTFNPWIGCRHVSPECDHCYADRMVTVRMDRDFGKVQRSKTWKHPLKWNREATSTGYWTTENGVRRYVELGRRPRVFCASLTDFFLQDADGWRPEAWELIRECTNLDWLILTKRPKLAASRLPADWRQGWPHVWIGTTCGCVRSEYRLDELRALPAVVRFVSAEPLLESMAQMNLTGINWLIVGGESGVSRADGGPRPMLDKWAIELRDKCAAEGVGFFFKQHSAFRPGQGQELEGREYHEAPLVQIS